MEKTAEEKKIEHTEHLGRQIIAEFFDADFDALNKAKELEQAMCDAAGVANATVLSSHSHMFEPHGVSSVVIIRQANLCIHTWPEFGYAAADFFTCGDNVDPWKAFESLKTFLKASKYKVVELPRGNKNLIKDSSSLPAGVIHRSLENKQERITVHEDEEHSDTRILIKGDELMDKQSQFQKVTMARNKWWGTILWLDNICNVTERDEFIYHEMIVHVPMLTHPDPRRVLIIGGGDGGSAREVLKHPNLEKAVMVDIDGDVVEACRKYMPGLSNGAFEDPRLELIIGDGIKYVQDAADGSFDVIIVDSTDPMDDSPGAVLFTDEFYSNCKRALSANGVISTQSLRPMRDMKHQYDASISALQNGFQMSNTYFYLISVDSYLGTMTLGLGFKGDSHPEKIDRARCKAFSKDNNLKYYTPGIHIGSFCLPRYLKEMCNIPIE